MSGLTAVVAEPRVTPSAEDSRRLTTLVAGRPAAAPRSSESNKEGDWARGSSVCLGVRLDS